jgi:SAM-dependent methyltransferase
MQAIRWGSLRKTKPVSRDFGFDRGTPIDRYYIEQFLAANAHYIRGRTLEIGDDSYTRQFGGNAASVRDVLHVHPGNPKATIIGDLASGTSIPSDTFDCAIITQTLHLIYDVKSALKTLSRILRPGGVLLATVPGISPIARDEWEGTWHWGFTRHSVRRMVSEVFSVEAIDVSMWGNVFASTCFVQGIAVQDVNATELDYRDPDHDTLITVRAIKQAGA